MKITSVPSVVTPSVDVQGNPRPSNVDSIRSMRMTTNATPLGNQYGQHEQPVTDNNKTEAVEATQPLSPQLALLAKQRRALQVKERELSDREKALTSDPTSRGIDVARLKSEPLRVLLENGVTYDQLTEAILAGQGGDSEIHALKAEIEALKLGIDKKFTDKDAQSKQQVLSEMKREAEKIVRENDDYELVREHRSVPDVIELIDRTYEENGEVLDVTDALRLVEEELFRRDHRITKFKKFQSQSQPMAQPQQRQSGMRTLTNRDTASVPLSAKARAMAAFYGTLKK